MKNIRKRKLFCRTHRETMYKTLMWINDNEFMHFYSQRKKMFSEDIWSFKRHRRVPTSNSPFLRRFYFFLKLDPVLIPFPHPHISRNTPGESLNKKPRAEKGISCSKMYFIFMYFLGEKLKFKSSTYFSHFLYTFIQLISFSI